MSPLASRFYLATQSVLIVAWWATLAMLPLTRDAFAPASIGGLRWLMWFLPADVITVVGGILAALWWRTYAGRLGVVLALIGISTQTLASFSVPLRTAGRDGWLGVGMMIAASIATLACASVTLIETRAAASLFRSAPATWTRRDIARRTVLQSAILWPLFLVVLPWTLSRLERAAGWEPPSSPLAITFRLGVGETLFVVAGVVNIATARVMIDAGGGTPLPVCMANRLVTGGPYACVRNPMCMSALLQGLAVSIMLASPLTASYVILGGVIWQIFIRPAEERDLRERFGTAYDAYRARVRCWWPVFGGRKRSRKR